jgi:acetyl coenzyme A synthetase (ADP forming)-like protein
LAAILRPRSLAVIGVSARAESLSGKLLSNLLAAGYRGEIYPVNPKASEILGLKCYPSAGALPAAPELAIVMVPRDGVLAAVDECVAAGVQGVVVITAGFREGGEAGAEAERRLLARVRQAGVRMVGPNCMGVICTDDDVRLDASFTPAPARPGSVAFASHSGALGVAVLEAARDAGLGFASFVSLGNSADVNVNDVLSAWEEDESVRVIMLYLEALPEPRRFLELAARIGRRKPIVVFKGGRTAAGQRAASSHTGALAAGDAAVDAVLKQAGVLRARTLAEMFDLALALSLAPLPAGRRVAIITNAGGPAIAAADALAGEGLTLATFAPATSAALASFLPAEAAVGNPVDMLPSATAENFRRALDLALADPGVDAALSLTVTPVMVGPRPVAEGIAAVARTAKPVLSVFMTNSSFYRDSLTIAGLPPVFRAPEAAVAALGGMARQAERAAAPAAPALGIGARPSRGLAQARGHGGRDLPVGAALAVVEEVGIAVAPWRIVDAGADLVGAAAELGYPVVLKAVGPGLVHKSDVGAVALGLADERELAHAQESMARRLAAADIAPEAYLLQRHVRGGLEVILGIVRDPAVGSLVLAGLGGVAVEVWHDVSMRLAPVTEAIAAAMLDELHGAPLLGAFRGRPPADREALVQALVRVSELAAAHPEIAECDINPLLVFERGRGCVAVDVRMRVDA